MKIHPQGTGLLAFCPIKGMGFLFVKALFKACNKKCSVVKDL